MSEFSYLAAFALAYNEKKVSSETKKINVRNEIKKMLK